jgi:hypothetical protein
MIEVHPPEEKIHGVRDFLLHLFTITIGLLIALGLEAAVENLHHRHVVREARENIHREIEQNQQAATKDLDNLKVNSASMEANIKKVRALRADRHALDHGEMDFAFSWSSFNQSAWTSARDSGALTYMPTEEVQRYADLYYEQEIINTQVVSTFTQETELSAPFSMETGPDKFTPEEIDTLLRGCAVTGVRLYTLHQIVEQLGKSYAEALKK